MKKTNKIRVVAVNNGRESGFNIYLDYSGRREYLTCHRHNELLYGLLKDGIGLDEMRRWKPQSHGRYTGLRYRVRRSNQLHNSVNHLLHVIDSYMLENAA